MSNREWTWTLIGLIVVMLVTARFVQLSLRKERSLSKRVLTWLWNELISRSSLVGIRFSAFFPRHRAGRGHDAIQQGGIRYGTLADGRAKRSAAE